MAVHAVEEQADHKGTDGDGPDDSSDDGRGMIGVIGCFQVGRRVGS